jgi:hypothetical protein
MLLPVELAAMEISTAWALIVARPNAAQAASIPWNAFIVPSSHPFCRRFDKIENGLDDEKVAEDRISVKQQIFHSIPSRIPSPNIYCKFNILLFIICIS